MLIRHFRLLTWLTCLPGRGCWLPRPRPPWAPAWPRPPPLAWRRPAVTSPLSPWRARAAADCPAPPGQARGSPGCPSPHVSEYTQHQVSVWTDEDSLIPQRSSPYFTQCALTHTDWAGVPFGQCKKNNRWSFLISVDYYLLCKVCIVN